MVVCQGVRVCVCVCSRISRKSHPTGLFKGHVVSSSPVYCVTKTIHVLDFAICSDLTPTAWHYVLHSGSVLKYEEIWAFPRTGTAQETNTNPKNICKLVNVL